MNLWPLHLVSLIFYVTPGNFGNTRVTAEHFSLTYDYLTRVQSHLPGRWKKFKRSEVQKFYDVMITCMSRGADVTSPMLADTYNMCISTYLDVSKYNYDSRHWLL